MENFIIKSNSNKTSTGFYYTIDLKKDILYKFMVNGTLTGGDKAYIYCEYKKGISELNDDRYIRLNEKTNRTFYLKGTDDSISFGILFMNKNVDYKMEINSISVRDETSGLNLN